jgi:hypothetical protein
LSLIAVKTLLKVFIVMEKIEAEQIYKSKHSAVFSVKVLAVAEEWGSFDTCKLVVFKSLAHNICSYYPVEKFLESFRLVTSDRETRGVHAEPTTSPTESLRDRAAIAAMQGLLAADANLSLPEKEVAIAAVQHADALIKALKETQS